LVSVVRRYTEPLSKDRASHQDLANCASFVRPGYVTTSGT